MASKKSIALWVLFAYVLICFVPVGFFTHDANHVKGKDVNSDALCLFQTTTGAVTSNITFVDGVRQAGVLAILFAKPPIAGLTDEIQTIYANRISLATAITELRRIAKTIIDNFLVGVWIFLANSIMFGLVVIVCTCLAFIRNPDDTRNKPIGFTFVVSGLIGMILFAVGMYYASAGIANYEDLMSGAFDDVKTLCVPGNNLPSSTVSIPATLVTPATIVGTIKLANVPKDPFTRDFHRLRSWLIVVSIVMQLIPVLLTIALGVAYIKEEYPNLVDNLRNRSEAMEWSRGSQAQQQVPLQSVHTVTAVDNIKLALAAGNGYQ